MSQPDTQVNSGECPVAEELTVPQAVSFDEHLRQFGSDSPAAKESCSLAEILRLLHDVLRPSVHSPTSATLTGVSKFADSFSTSSPDLTVDGPLKRTTLPSRFQVRHLLGKGGFGIVYLATDNLLQRDVAIKVPHQAALENEEARIRFLRESQALARLNHPCIVRVLDSGSCDGSAWQVTEYVDGPRLSDFLREHGGVLSAENAATILSQLADGVQHAHDQGVLHRDIKPDNILMELVPVKFEINKSESRLFPRLTDFGLAKLVDEDVNISRAGLLIGTPMYMAPEQLKGRPEWQGRGTDIYALGVVLYELLTGTMPFPEATSLHARISVADQPVASFRKNTPGISKDIETICLKCLNIHPEERYATAAQLRDDLLRFLDGRPTLARPLPTHERFARWVQRNQPIAAAIAVVLMALLVILTQTLNSDRRTRAQNLRLTQTLKQLKQEKTRSDLLRELADKSRQEAEVNETKFRSLAWNSSIREALKGLLQHEYFSVRKTLNNLRFSQPESLRRPEWQLIASELDRHFDVLFETNYALNELRAVPGTNLLAIAGDSSMVHLIDYKAHRKERSFSTNTTEIHAIAVSPDGKRIAVGGITNSDDVSVPTIYAVETGMLECTLAPQSTTIESLLFSSDGRYLICGCRYEPVRIFDLENGTELSLPTTRRNQWLQESFDATRIMVHKDTDSILIADLKSGSVQKSITLPADIEYCLLRPGSDLLACSSYHFGSIDMLDLESGQVCGRLRHSGKAFASIAFFDFQKSLVAGRVDGSIVTWKIPEDWGRAITDKLGSGEQLSVIREVEETQTQRLDDQSLTCIVSIDETLYCTTASGRLTAYRCPSVEVGENGRVVDNSPWRSAVIDDSTGDVFIGTNAGEILSFSRKDLPAGMSSKSSAAALTRAGLAKVAYEERYAIDCLAIDGKSRHVVWSNWTQQLQITHLGSAMQRQLSPQSDNHNGGIDAVCFSDSGNLVAWTGSDKHLSIRNLDGLSDTRRFPLSGYGNAICFSPDSKTIACGGSFDGLVLIDSQTLSERTVLPKSQRCSAITWNHTGDSLLLGFADGSVSIRRLDDLPSSRISLHRKEVRQIALHPTSDFAASVDQSGQVALWNPLSGEVMGVLFEPELIAAGIVSMAPAIEFIGENELMLVLDDGDVGPQILRWQLEFQLPDSEAAGPPVAAIAPASTP